MSPFRRLARHLPGPVRHLFVRVVDRAAGRRDKPGKHHQGGAA